MKGLEEALARRRIAVVTGIGSGIGLAAGIALARHGYDLIGVVRNETRASETQARFEREAPDANVRFAIGDLSKQREVERVCDEIDLILRKGYGGHLDRLVLCAGAVTSWYLATEDGYETQFAVNHLAPFRMAIRLSDALKGSEDGRLILVSSGSHYRTRIRWNDVMMRRLYNPLLAYKQSKLANVLFVHGYNARYGDATRRAYAVDPGLVDTGIGEKGTSGIVRWVWARRRRHGSTPDIGAATVVSLACTADRPSGEYDFYKGGRSVRPSPYSLKKTHADRLWAISERLCGLHAEEGRQKAGEEGFR